MHYKPIQMQSANRSHKLVKVHSAAVPTRCAAKERRVREIQKIETSIKEQKMKTLLLECHKRRKKAGRRRFSQQVFQQYLSAATTDNFQVIACVVLRSMVLFIVFAPSSCVRVCVCM